MRLAKPAPQDIRRWVHKLAPLGAAVAAILLCAGAALGQQCTNNVSPAETFTFPQASLGSATPGAFSNGGSVVAFGFVDGTDSPSQQRVAAAAVIFGIVGGATANGFGQIDYVFCVPGRISSSQVAATISAQVLWYGVLAGATLGTNVPSVTGSFNLIDMGTDGKGSNLVAGATPLNGTLNTLQISPLVLNVNINGGITNGTVPVALQTQVTVGHVYDIQFNLDCQATAGITSSVSFCDFTPTLPTQAIPFANLPPGDYHAEVSNVTVTLGPDLYATLLGIKAEVDNLTGQLATVATAAATRNELESTKLTLEQENAQLLGILNEILGLLPAKPADPPPAPTSGKTKTGDPKLPIRTVRPAANDPP